MVEKISSTALEIAACQEPNGRAFRVHEVCVLFNNQLIQDRCTKSSADQFFA